MMVAGSSHMKDKQPKSMGLYPWVRQQIKWESLCMKDKDLLSYFGVSYFLLTNHILLYILKLYKKFQFM